MTRITKWEEPQSPSKYCCPDTFAIGGICNVPGFGFSSSAVVTDILGLCQHDPRGVLVFPMSSDGLEELNGAFRCYFWLPVWAPRSWREHLFLVSHPVRLVYHLLSSGSLLCYQILILMLFGYFCKSGVLLAII